MHIKITGRHMEMTDALKSYIENGLQKIETHFDKVLEADVILDVQKYNHIAEVNLRANGIRINGKEISPDMYASVDAVMAKLEKQIRKYKDRINRHQPRTAREARSFSHAIISVGAAIPENGQPHTVDNVAWEPHTVVHHEKLTMPPMSVDEAVVQFELVDDPFLVFFNAETSQVNVIYSRGDGTYGVIEPQV